MKTLGGIGFPFWHEDRVHKSRHETSLGVCGRRNQTEGDARTTYDRGREAHEDAVSA